VTTEINRGYLDHIRRSSRPSANFGARLRALGRRVLQVVLVPVSFLVAGALIVGLRLAHVARPAVTKSPLHDEALAFVDRLVEQYPMHLYPLVAKALELAYVNRRLNAILKPESRVLEIAIGEGTLSARLFTGRARVTGVDLNPHSLAKAARLPHVERAIVGDGLHPPVRPGAFDLLLSLNFLHHITDKQTTVANWTSLARVALFNENTTYWATSWTVPFVLRRIGAVGLADRRARAIELHSLQHLKDRLTLDREIGDVAHVRESVSFVSARTFFLCGLFSFLMLCYGPPTPAILKRLFLGPLRPLAIPLTASLARLLIAFDAGADRTKDTFVFYECDGQTVESGPFATDLLCPRCSAGLKGDACDGCGARYGTADGMLFLLPPQFAYVFDDYVRHEAVPVPAEHL
jgi:hypothetical protein